MRKSLVHLIAIILICLGSLLICLGVGYLIYSQVAQARMRDLEARSMNELSSPATPTPFPSPTLPAPTPTTAPAPTSTPTPTPAPTPTPTPTPTPGPTFPPAVRIVIPSIQLDAPVVEKDYPDTASHAVAHYKGTANPGEYGNAIMSGHKFSTRGEGNVFQHLIDLVEPFERGERIEIIVYDQGGGVHTYHVVACHILGKNNPLIYTLLEDTPDPTLTLVTCEPLFVASFRLIVVAKLEEV